MRASAPLQQTLAVLEAAANAYMPDMLEMRRLQWEKFVNRARPPAEEAARAASNMFDARVFASTHNKMASKQKLEMRVSPSTAVALLVAEAVSLGESLNNDDLTNGDEDYYKNIGSCKTLTPDTPCLRLQNNNDVHLSDYAKVCLLMKDCAKKR